jgi:CBS domain-containing protein
MRFISEVLRRKGHDVASVRPDQTVYEMLELMMQRNIGAVVVLEGGGEHARLVGICTERDYARSVVLLGRSSKDTLVREIMTPDPIVVTPSHRVRECMQIMTERRVRHLPVVKDGQLVGLISIGDAVKTIMDEQEALIADLESYISP